MTQVFNEDGKVVPVTRLQVFPCQITQVKKDAVQVGFGNTKEYLLKKPQLGHLKGLTLVKNLKEFKLDNTDNFKKGNEIAADTFVAGEKVAVQGVSKGKGFQGVVKRHGFKGSKATHGNKDQLRASGSIGATGPQKVFKGLRMAGRMGGDQITVNNLEIVKVDLENNEILVKGAVPGARNGILTIFSKDGELKMKVQNTEDRKEGAVGKEQVATPEEVGAEKEGTNITPDTDNITQKDDKEDEKESADAKIMADKEEKTEEKE